MLLVHALAGRLRCELAACSARSDEELTGLCRMTKLGSARWGMRMHVPDYRKAIRTRWMTIAPANCISYTLISYTRGFGLYTEFKNFQIRFLIPYTRFLPDSAVLGRTRVSFINMIFMGHDLCLTVSVKRISPVIFGFDTLTNF